MAKPIVPMPRLDKHTKERIRQLDPKVLSDIVIGFASKNQELFDHLLVHHLDKEGGEQELFQAARADLDGLFYKRYKGFSDQLRMANMLAACLKRVNGFSRVSKNKVHEAELLLQVLEVPFGMPDAMLGTCFTQYDTKVAAILKRLIDVVTKKLHEDLRMEYAGTVNGYLQRIHRASSHLDVIYKLPKAI